MCLRLNTVRRASPDTNHGRVGVVMRLLTFLIISAIVLAHAAPAAFAADSGAACAQTKYILVYGNGVLAPYHKAATSKLRLFGAVQAALPSDKQTLLRADLAYNATHGAIADLLESSIQSLHSDYVRFWDILLGILPMPSSFRDKLINIVAPLSATELVGGQDLATHVGIYKSNILTGNKVVLTAHSQGNFFANESYSLLSSTEKSSFGIAAVAEPDTFVAGDGPYTTLNSDLVILGITALKSSLGLPTPLPPNIHNTRVTDVTGHYFDETYMMLGSASRAKIVGDVVSLFSTLQTPPGQGSEGIIEATLTWGAQPDVDLHAFEPSGDHVYYANKRGVSGALDVDVVTGFGPEHYTVDCGTLQAGTYRIGVNYFRGSAPETAHIDVKAGLDVRSFTTLLSTAVGSAGNNSPIPVATITVDGTADSGYRFSIAGATAAEQRNVRAAAQREVSVGTSFYK